MKITATKNIGTIKGGIDEDVEEKEERKYTGNLCLPLARSYGKNSTRKSEFRHDDEHLSSITIDL